MTDMVRRQRVHIPADLSAEIDLRLSLIREAFEAHQVEKVKEYCDWLTDPDNNFLGVSRDTFNTMAAALGAIATTGKLDDPT